MAYYFKVGGPILWVLFFMSMGALAIILEKTVFFTTKEKKVDTNFKKDINDLISAGKVEEAIQLCETQKGSVAGSIKTFLKRAKKGQDVQDYESIIKEIMLESMSPLDRGLSSLEAIGSLAPMCGLLGTVTGMIKAFINISKMGAGDPTIVADGISEALVTTAAGLYVAIPVIAAYNIFSKIAARREDEVDKIVSNIINIFRR
ncbi:transporter, MotA/TolQ/ExbB proton channel family protein [Fusobacterium equinum]|uniref:Transporter, MotA/TolQ/ExbB proton channel family protein n=1 Tax=Fusobacterium equinum TaxID=134605 RepID=A0A133N9U8_9FUSO|nr:MULTISPECIES: MotA/TolQ/ExbB proton channel family protein [Fusobacterium]KXA13067.1 transporter, MotA/TolQ/ExbB proton channel family protein [Fusobacterium equinum]